MWVGLNKKNVQGVLFKVFFRILVRVFCSGIRHPSGSQAGWQAGSQPPSQNQHVVVYTCMYMYILVRAGSGKSCTYLVYTCVY